MVVKPAPQRSLADVLFHDEPAGAFSAGHIVMSAPDLGDGGNEPGVGYWRCDIAEDDKLTWSDKVYELFGLPAGTPVARDWAVSRYREDSRSSLESVRTYALSRRLSFILDAAITPKRGKSRWIRVLAVPILTRGRVTGLHGLKRALPAPA